MNKKELQKICENIKMINKGESLNMDDIDKITKELMFFNGEEDTFRMIQIEREVTSENWSYINDNLMTTKQRKEYSELCYGDEE